MWRSIASNFLTIAIVLIAGVAGIIAWGKNQYSGPGPLTDAICLKVPNGATFRSVAADLADRKAVSSAYILKVGAEYEGKTAKLKAGSFLVPEHASMAEIVDAVTRGGQSTCGTEVNYQIGVNAANLILRELDPATSEFAVRAEFDPTQEAAPEIYAAKRAEPDTRYRIALAEGVTSWQVVEALRAIDVLEGEIAEVPPEGMLAPDSYEVVPGTLRADLLAQMEEKQRLRIAAAWESRQDGLPISTPEEMLVLASIIEKETGVPEERGQVASVFVNRLNQGMRLQTDPTVIYGITKGQGVLGRGLRQSELRSQTPWNTYVIDGLPPTPIANPGVASLEAAVAPEQTGYVFFVADGSGGHVFAETLEEHNRNVAQWRKIEAEKSGN